MHTLRYTDGYQAQDGPRPASLTLTLLMGGAIVSAMFFISPHFTRIAETTLETFPVRVDPPPPPDPQPKPKEHPKALEQQRELYVPPPPLPPPVDTGPKFDVTTKPPPETFAGGGTVPAKPEPAKPAMMTGAELDQRYAANFQPTYPADEIRGGREGHVTVRVLIGTDGHVLQVEKVTAASDSFFEATRRRALDKWRFKPATRDGVPYETWKTVGVTFVLDNQ